MVGNKCVRKYIDTEIPLFQMFVLPLVSQYFTIFVPLSLYCDAAVYFIQCSVQVICSVLTCVSCGCVSRPWCTRRRDYWDISTVTFSSAQINLTRFVIMSSSSNEVKQNNIQKWTELPFTAFYFTVLIFTSPGLSLHHQRRPLVLRDGSVPAAGGGTDAQSASTQREDPQPADPKHDGEPVPWDGTRHALHAGTHALPARHRWAVNKN